MKTIPAFLVIWIVCSSVAWAQMQCGTRESIIKLLKSPDYTEAQIGLGLDNRGRVVELWRNDRTGGFTILATNAYGWTCIILSGTSWEPRPRIIGKES